MALRSIIKEPDELLRKKSRRVEKIDEKIITLLEDMAETMVANDGMGIAAVQVGVLKRVVLVRADEDSEILELINPEIVEQSGSQVQNEGCLSVSGRRGNVKRPRKVRVRAQNREGEWLEYEAQGYMAVAFCHELDHLDGVLFIDKATEILPE